MKRYKRIYILLGVLVVACAITFGVSQYEEQQELYPQIGRAHV